MSKEKKMLISKIAGSVIQIIITIIFMIVTDFDIITKLVGCVIIGFIELFIRGLIEIYMFRWYDD